MQYSPTKSCIAIIFASPDVLEDITRTPQCVHYTLGIRHKRGLTRIVLENGIMVPVVKMS